MGDTPVTPPRWTVGQTVFVEAVQRYASDRDGVVTKVGRTWVTVADADRPSWEIGKFRVDTGYEQSNVTPARRIHSSREAREAEKALVQSWDTLRRRMWDRFTAPDGVTLDVIAQATALLFPEPAP